MSYNDSYGSNTGTSYGGGSNDRGIGGLLSQFSGADEVASSHAGSSGDKDLFSNVMSMVSGKQDQLKDEDVDEDDYVNKHDSYYGSGAGTGGSATSGGIGKAAAVQAMKLFNQGETSGSSGGDSKSAFMGLAMGQAAKLFDQQSSAGNVSDSESKESAIQQAGEAALKMYIKSEMGMGGSSSSSGLMGMASKFLR